MRFTVALVLSVTLFLSASAASDQQANPTGLEAGRIADLEDQLGRFEKQLELYGQVKDERIDGLYGLLQIFGVVAGALLVVLTIRETLHRRSEVHRQVQLDDMVKELVGFQKTTLTQHNEFGEMFVAQAGRSLEQQQGGLQSVNEVIGVVKETLEFRLEQEKTVAQALKVGQAIKEQTEKRQRRRYERALDLAKAFKPLSRMAFASLPEELYKRGTRLRGDVEELSYSDIDIGTPIEMGRLYYTSGVLAFYDNDVSDAAHYLSLSARTRVDDHQGEIQSNSDYRYRIAFSHYFLALLEKNWGTLEEAQSQIRMSHDLTRSDPGEMLTPATMLEILSYFEGQEEECREELGALMNRIAEVERAARAQGGSLDANQMKLRVRLLLLRGNTYHAQARYDDALAEYSQAERHAPDDYYVLSSKAIALDRLPGRESEARAAHRKCLDRIEESGALANKREFSTRVLLNLVAGIAARGAGETLRAQDYATQVLDLVRTDVSLNGRTPKFFSPLTKRLVDSSAIRGEAERLRDPH